MEVKKDALCGYEIRLHFLAAIGETGHKKSIGGAGAYYLSHDSDKRLDKSARCTIIKIVSAVIWYARNLEEELQLERAAKFGSVSSEEQ